MPPTTQEIVRNPQFLGLPEGEQVKVLQRVDPNFAGMVQAEQLKAVRALRGAPIIATASRPPVETETGPVMHSTIRPEAPAPNPIGLLASGFNKGLAEIIGMPVDTMQTALEHLPGVSEPDLQDLITGQRKKIIPFGGSASIKQGMQAIGIPDIQPRDPEEGGSHPGDRILRRIGEELGGTVPYVAGPLNAASKVTAATRAATPVAQNAIERLAAVPKIIVDEISRMDPGKLTMIETALASGAGLGAGVLNEIFPSSKQMADFFGELAGGFGTGALLGIVRAAKAVKSGVVKLMGGMTQADVEREVGKRIGQLGDEQKIDKGVERADQLAEQIPGFHPTTGQATGEPGLIQSERAFERKSSERAGRFATKRQASKTAIRDFVEEGTPSGNVADVGVGVELHRAEQQALFGQTLQREQARVNIAKQAVSAQTQRVLDMADKRLTLADQRAQQRVEALRGRISESEVGKIIRQEYRKELDTFETEAEQRFASIDPENRVELPTDILKARADAVKASFDPRVERSDRLPSQVLTTIDTLTSGEGSKVKYNTLRRLRSEILAQKREARAAGNGPLTRRLIDLQDGVEANMAAIPEEFASVKQAADSANQFYKEGMARLKSGTADRLRRVDESGRFRTHDEDAADLFLKGETSLEDFVSALGNRPLAQDALKDAVRHDFYRNTVDVETGRVNPKRAAKWAADHQPVLDQFPDLANDVTGAIRSQRLADTLRKEYDEIAKNPARIAKLRNPQVFGDLDAAEQRAARVLQTVERSKAQQDKSAASLFLGVDVNRAADKIIGSGQPVRLVKQVLKELANDPIGRRGFERAMWDSALSRFESKAVDAVDRPILQAQRMKEFLLENQDWMEPLFGKARLDRMRTAQEALSMIERTGRPVTVGGSDTALNLKSQGLDWGPVFSRLFAAQSGRVSERFIVAERLGRWMNKHIGQVSEKQMEDLLQEAFFDPKVAQTLMMNAQGANDRLITTRIHAHLLNMNQPHDHEMP